MVVNNLTKESLKNVDGLIKGFWHSEDIGGFEILLTNFVFKDHVDHTIYLNPRRDKNVKYCISGDTAFMNFKGDEKYQLSFAKKLKGLLTKRQYPCSVFVRNQDCKNVDENSCGGPKKVKWDFNRIEVVL